ncbi:hypothetical protein O7632_14085 [Solwaraspora sp. WMMD406]|uniref:hypothetical protein n=1 Tax=Solwaraspora sp. WMMD406 TaxID=3016095 RepID=UPI002416E866|nr:hypothetical protein [Solwaraspora sp. WMMD406]MDG4765215.1 hypothetical protein [Solwaraspora sp. WMMD406]
MSLVERFPTLPELATHLRPSSAEGTIKTYRDALASFLAFLVAGAHQVATPADVRRSHVEQWQADLIDQGRATATRIARLKTVRRSTGGWWRSPQTPG